MLYEKKYFGNGSGNFDDADFVLQPNQWVNMENCRVKSTDKGVIGTVESIGSMEPLSSIAPSELYRHIGSVEDEENRRIIYFLKDLIGSLDKIICYYIDSGVFHNVLLSTQVIGGLNFGTTSFIHSARIVNGWLYWVEGTNNEPRKIGIDAGIKMNNPPFPSDVAPYIDPIDWRDMTLIKPPPPLAPNILKYNDSGFANNFIANESFMFAFQYIYYTNETSVIGTYSPASRLNSTTDIFNSINVTMDITELIPQTVRIVNLIVRYSNIAFIIRTWDKLISDDNFAINVQNLGLLQLSYLFHNNITGEAISADMILKPFDSVPIYSKALEVARNRTFLANNIAGYDTPTTTSLSFSYNTLTLSGTGLVLTLLEWVQSASALLNRYYSAYYVYLTSVSPIGYYAITATEQFCLPCSGPPPLPAPPPTITLGSLTFRGETVPDVIASVNAHYGTTMPFSGQTIAPYSTILTGATVSTYNIFKGRSQYKLGVVFYDYAMRKCGVIMLTDFVNIPARTFAMSTAIGTINWALSNANALDEIPEWAHYYSVVRTLNINTRYFLQAVQQTSNAKYATKNTDGVYEFTNDSFITSAVGIGLDTTSLVQAGLGYTFTEGDVCYLIKEDDSSFTLSVIAQVGKYIIVNVPEGGIGDFTTFKIIYEIYIPYRSSNQEPYYEVGEMHKVLNPRTSSRAYNDIVGQFLPDAYALSRNYDSITYFAETMSPNDRFFNRWDTDAGKVNYVVNSGQSVKEQSISFSNVYIPGTATNGLSTYEALNQNNSIPLENGAIQKIILTSKTQDQGTIMLAVCTNETSSIYLGETQILDNTGSTQFFAASSGVIGTINSLKGSFGTLNPESVVEFRGNVYWVDILNGKVIQYSLNGLFPISNYKMTRYWNLFCEQYLSMTPDQIIALGSLPYIISTVDPHHWELLITVPRVLQNPPMGYLPDMPGTVYPYDIWDGQAKTLVYKINSEPNFWQGSYAWTPEGYVTSQNKLFSFKNGVLYECNITATYGNFFGVQYKSRIMFVCNQQPERDKVYDNISVEANLTPTLTYFMSLQPFQQVSNLLDFDWKIKESTQYCQIYRNVLTPSATGLKPNALVTGEKMRTYAFRVMLEFTVGTTPLELRFVNIGYQLSLGNSTPIQ